MSVNAVFLAVFLEATLKVLYRPIDYAVGRIIEHLTDYFPSYPGICPSLDLYDYWHALVGDE